MTGAHGLIGSALARRLKSAGHRVTPLVRRPARAGEISWDPATRRLEPGQLEGVDAVIHLAGENVGARWTAARKSRIRNSRIVGTRVLSEALGRARRPPAVLISASGIGIYGNRGDETLTENSPLGDRRTDFLAAVGQEWEAAAEPARAAGLRVVHPRFGVVLSPEGGALSKMLVPFRLGLGGRLGRGLQWMSWISIDDAVGAIVHTLLTESFSGPVNVVGPEPVQNRDFTAVLGRVLSRPAPFAVPAAALRLVFGEMADATLLASTRVLPKRLLASGYRFEYPDLETALGHVLQVPH
ncbi:MAG TPA: TIGR01777 family oxidoreductase [Gemmatimonadales bacterium]|nr:TIGR01777 family oxidoreductase [Gemmatimonadales bacterium]